MSARIEFFPEASAKDAIAKPRSSVPQIARDNSGAAGNFHVHINSAMRSAKAPIVRDGLTPSGRGTIAPSTT